MIYRRFVYFIRPVGMLGPIKIGCADVPSDRLRPLMRWSPFPLEVAAKAPGDLKLEFRVHCCFAHVHSHCEWFLPAADLVEAVHKIASGVPLEEAVDLDRPTGTIRKEQAKVEWTPERRFASGTRFRVFGALRRAPGFDIRTWNVPSDILAIIDALHVRAPTEEERARIDEFCAAPVVHASVRALRIAA